MYGNQMNKRNYIFATTLIMLGVLCVVPLITSRSVEPTTPTSSVLTPITSPLTNKDDVSLPQEPRQAFANAEKPDSLSGVELTTHRSQYGYEVTHPSTWKVEEYGARLEVGVLNTWTLSPIEPPEHLNPLMVIVVYDVATDIYEGMYTGTGSGRILLNPDATPGQTRVEWNGVRGTYKEGFGGVSAYDFLKDGRRYSIMLNDTLLFKAGLSEAELEWVLSTFKIVQ